MEHKIGARRGVFLSRSPSFHHTPGPDIEAVDEVKALILESVNEWKNYNKRVPSRGPSAQKRPRDEECLLSSLGA